jgi:Fe-S-cluster containining protein
MGYHGYISMLICLLFIVSGTTLVGDNAVKSFHPVPPSGTCSRCGECCRWLPIIPVRQCKPHQIHYFRERGLKEADGLFLAFAPCRHLREEGSDASGAMIWGCAIYDSRPATCRDFCGRTLSGGKRYYVPDRCTMAGEGRRKLKDGEAGPVSEGE